MGREARIARKAEAGTGKERFWLDWRGRGVRDDGVSHISKTEARSWAEFLGLRKGDRNAVCGGWRSGIV